MVSVKDLRRDRSWVGVHRNGKKDVVMERKSCLRRKTHFGNHPFTGFLAAQKVELETPCGGLTRRRPFVSALLEGCKRKQKLIV